MTSQRQPLKKAREHSLDLKQLGLGYAMLNSIHYLQVSGKQEKVLEFTGGSHGHVQKLAEFGPSSPAAALCDVRRNRARRASHLAAQSKSLFDRELPSEPIDMQDEIVASLPNAKFSEILHDHPVASV